MNCGNCGKENPIAVISVLRVRPDGVELRPMQSWCLECVQGKNPIKDHPT